MARHSLGRGGALKVLLGVLIVLIIAGAGGANSHSEQASQDGEQLASQEQSQAAESASSAAESGVASAAKSASAAKKAASSAAAVQTAKKSSSAKSTKSAKTSKGLPSGWKSWNESAYPDYIRKVGTCVKRHKASAGKVSYGDLDSKGRATYAVGELTHGLRVKAQARGRKEMSEGLDPSGWGHNGIASIETPGGGSYRGYFWNRSHLLADSLGGDAILQNLVTGTRMQNVGANDGRGGMAYSETLARDWLDAHGSGSLYYCAQALYSGGEAIPRAVLVDMKSTDGAIDEEIIVYNTAKGYKINYDAGTFAGKGGSSSAVAAGLASSPASKSSASSMSKQSSKTTVYLSKSAAHYHVNKNCRGLASAAFITSISLAEAKQRGIPPCAICSGQ